jgi:hypothetical protein
LIIDGAQATLTQLQSVLENSIDPSEFQLLTRKIPATPPNQQRDLLIKLLEILVVLNVIPEDKVLQLKTLMSTLIQPDLSYSQVTKTHQTPLTRSRTRERSQLRSHPRNNGARTDSSQGWHTKRPCRNQDKGCNKIGNPGPMTMHERECPFKPNGKMENERTPAGKSFSSLQTFFKKQQ